MVGYEWENPGIMLLSSTAFAEEAAPEQPHHVLPYERSSLELAGVFSPFPPTSLVTVAAAPGEELGYSLHHYAGLLLPPTTAELQPSSASRMGLNGGLRTCFSSSPAGDLTRLGASVCRWLSGEAEAGEGGVLGGLSCNEDVPYGPRARCQADGCAADLETAKHYHRRHKVCEYHSKAAVVVADGRTQRFCQQCSRFHVLSEFDKGKRSCRSRLAEHNRRRRKYQAPPPLPSPPPPPPTASNSTTSAATANPPNPASGCEPPGGVW